MHLALEEIVAALDPLSRGGTFASRRCIDAGHLRLSIKGLGPLELPLTAESGRALVAQAAQSPFGWRERTVMDRSVRDGWEVAKSRLKIDGRRWNPVLRGCVAELAEALGLPPSVRLVPKLDKLTIYGPGQFFKPHKDTEKSDSMIGSLVVVLPSRYTGGALRVERGTERYEVRRTTRRVPKLDVVAFYADCVHEVRPVKTGYRVALVYTLEVSDSAAGGWVNPGETGALQAAVRAYFDTPQVRFGGDETPRRADKLVYLLDHEYTERSLGWGQLKEADGPRAHALREVAGALDLDAYLCLSRISEMWQCEPEYSGGRWRSRGGWDDDDDEGDDDDDDEGDANPVDLVESTVELVSWRDAQGGPASFDGLHVRDSEVCVTLSNDALKPAGSQYEGYMGNYGCTLERWYERAAVVMWPRSRAFAMVVDGDPVGAVRTVLGGLRKGTAEAPGQLSILVERIAEHRDVARESASWTRLLELGEAAADPVVARGLLERFPPPVDGLSLRSAKAFALLLKRYSAELAFGLMRGWHGDGYARAGFDVYPSLWVQQVVGEAGKTGRAVASVIATGQIDAALARLEGRGVRGSRSPYVAPGSRGAWTTEEQTPSTFGQALGSCVAARVRSPFDRCVATLSAEDGPLGALDLATVAIGLEVSEGAPLWVGRGVAKLLRTAEAGLKQLAVRVDREPGDWTIDVPVDCRCADCAELHAFLRSPGRTVGLPLNKARRMHLHREIDGACLPVAHTTRRQGSPYVLVLRKDEALFTRDRELLVKLTALRAEIQARRA